MSAHTPGPLELVPEPTGMGDVAYYIREADAEPADILAAIYYRNEAEADGRLFASAPDLLAACEAALEAWEDCENIAVACGRGRTDPEPHDISLLRSAIRKARGEA